MEQLIIAAVLIVIGYFWGTANETKHYSSIRDREKTYAHIATTSFKTPPVKAEQILSSRLVQGSTVISIDHFKRFLAGLRMLVGGRLTSYESLVDRARREAILRMKEHAGDHTMIVNVKVETSSISKGQKDAVGSIEVLAYGTAIKIDETHS